MGTVSAARWGDVLLPHLQQTPLAFYAPTQKKAAATQSDNGLMYPAGLEFMDTIHARVACLQIPLRFLKN